MIKLKLSQIYRHSGKFFHRGRLTLTFECGYILKERFPNGYKTGDESFCTRFIRYIQDIFEEMSLLTQRNINAKVRIIGVLCNRGKYLHPDLFHIAPEIMDQVQKFLDDFNFSRPYISTADIKDIKNKKVLLNLLESIEEIEIEDLIGICDENGIHYVARTYLIDSLRPDFIRVDESTLMRPEFIGITDEIISAVVESIHLAIERNGCWQAAQTFDDYEWLPQLEISWNSFLLA